MTKRMATRDNARLRFRLLATATAAIAAVLAWPQAVAGASGAPVHGATIDAPDDFDRLRTHWNAINVGSANDMRDPDVAASVRATAAEAKRYLDAMDRSAGRRSLWSDLAELSLHAPAAERNCERLGTMATAWAQPGGSMRGNAALGRAIVGGLDWLYANHYNENLAEKGNWWDWQIGIPQCLGKTAMLVYPLLTPAQIANYTKAMNHFVPTPLARSAGPVMTGANLSDQVEVVLASGVLAKDGARIALARDNMSPLFPYVTKGDGFHADGSFIQHGDVAYTGSYGNVLLGDVALLLDLFNHSAWPVADPDQGNVWQWALQSYAPLLYDGAMMDMVSGRKLSRVAEGDHASGRSVLDNLAKLALGAPAAQRASIQSVVKGQVTRDTTYKNYYAGLGPYAIATLKAIMADNSIAPAPAPTASYNFASMARVVHARPGFAFGLSLFSPTITAYEVGNGENLKGWYTGAGMTYLYTADQTQYDDNYWPTVDLLRLPGVTTDGATEAHKDWSPMTNPDDWVGGSVLNGMYTSAGMQFSMANVTGSTLAGKKSWFFFDDKMVALGAGITSGSDGAVETIVDNRKIDAAGDNALVVNGKAQPTALATSPTTLADVRWAWLDGNIVHSGIGYYFPAPVSLDALRERRSGSWRAINEGGPTASHTNHFVSLALAHGTRPAAASYAYVVLPNQTEASMARYAARPDIVVLANTASVQAVIDTSIDVVGANFWTNSATTVNDQHGVAWLSTAQQASVTTQQRGSELDVAVSDPTRANTGTITLTIHRRAASVISSDPQVTVTRLSPTIQLSVNVDASAGKSYSVRFGGTAPASQHR